MQALLVDSSMRGLGKNPAVTFVQQLLQSPQVVQINGIARLFNGSRLVSRTVSGICCLPIQIMAPYFGLTGEWSGLYRRVNGIVILTICRLTFWVPRLPSERWDFGLTRDRCRWRARLT